MEMFETPESEIFSRSELESDILPSNEQPGLRFVSRDVYKLRFGSRLKTFGNRSNMGHLW